MNKFIQALFCLLCIDMSFPFSSKILIKSIKSKCMTSRSTASSCILYSPPHRQFNAIHYVNKRNSMFMSLEPLSSSQVNMLFPRSVSNEQWISYWGVNEKERLQRILESFLIAYGGGWLAWYYFIYNHYSFQ